MVQRKRKIIRKEGKGKKDKEKKTRLSRKKGKKGQESRERNLRKEARRREVKKRGGGCIGPERKYEQAVLPSGLLIRGGGGQTGLQNPQL
jgi:hypothetical protein